MLYIVDFKNKEFIFCKWSENLVEAKIRILLESGFPKNYLRVLYCDSEDELSIDDDMLDVDLFRDVCERNGDFDEETICYLVDIDKRRKTGSLDAFVVNSWDDFNKKYSIDRDDLDLDTEREYLEDAYRLYEAEGFSNVFWLDNPGLEDELGECDGKPFEVIGRSIDSGDFPVWDDFLPAWTIRLSNGEEFPACPYQIITRCMKEYGCPFL